MSFSSSGVCRRHTWLCAVGSLNKTIFQGHIIVTTTFMATKYLLCLKSLREASYLRNKHILLKWLSASFGNYPHIISLPQCELAILASPCLPAILQKPASSVLFPCPHSHGFSFQECSLPLTSHLRPSHFVRANSTFSSLKTMTMPGLSDILPSEFSLRLLLVFLKFPLNDLHCLLVFHIMLFLPPQLNRGFCGSEAMSFTSPD